jgi:adenylate cyclase
VRNGGGDVLKFLGDGVLAIFPVEASRTDACRAALEAVAEARLACPDVCGARLRHGDRL